MAISFEESTETQRATYRERQRKQDRKNERPDLLMAEWRDLEVLDPRNIIVQDSLAAVSFPDHTVDTLKHVLRHVADRRCSTWLWICIKTIIM